jgi:hypothetical protein
VLEDVILKGMKYTYLLPDHCLREDFEAAKMHFDLKGPINGGVSGISLE